MSIAISPRHTTDDFPNGLRLEDKIEVFIARVEGWHLGPANEMVQKQIAHRAFAILSIITSYFEMIAKYRDGFAAEGRSGHYFKEGLREVFPTMALPANEAILDALYDNVRNGLYHAGMTRAGVLLTNDISHSVGFHSAAGTLVINPDILVSDLQIHFARYAAELRDPVNSGFRTNFEKRFDFDNN